MAARNTPDSFGWVSRLIHWVMALAIIGMLGLGTYIANAEPKLSNIWLFGLHKSIGLTLFALLFLRLAWHRISPPPAPLTRGIPGWQLAAARWTHRALYALMLLIPIAGWVGSSATGIDTLWFGYGPLPRIAPVSPQVEDAAFAIHSVLTKLLLALLLLHIAGAVERHVVHRDRTLRRMLLG